MKFITVVFFALSFLTLNSAALAQQPAQPQPPPPAQPPRPPAERGMRPGPGGKWWDNPDMAKKVGITSDQKKKMDDVFLQARLKLIDLHASLEKDELTLEGLMQGATLDDSKILPGIDKIAQDRAELEKADARMLLGIRHILTPEQWTTLDQMEHSGPPQMGPMQGRGRQGGPGGGPGGPRMGPGAPPPPM